MTADRRPVLAVPSQRGHRTREIVLEAAPVAMGPSLVLGWTGGQVITLSLDGVPWSWFDDLLQALVEARRVAHAPVRP